MKTALKLFALISFFSFLYADTDYVPQWWVGRITESIAHEADAEVIEGNYKAVNIGQLMNMAMLARAELAAKTGSAGTSIDSMVNDFINNHSQTTSHPELDVSGNYELANIGQLKYVAEKFYDRLWEIKAISPNLVKFPEGIVFLSGGTNASNHKYPWPEEPAASDPNYETEKAKNYAIANIGQVKFIFSWSIVYADANSNEVDDAWEAKYFGALVGNVNTDPNGDGISILDAYRLGLDPTKNYSDPSVSGTAAKAITYDNNSMILGIGTASLIRDDEGNVTSFGNN